VAAHAGVRRSTVYRHFPDEASLFDACSTHWLESNPLPDPAAWAAIADRDGRVHAALADLYGYYRANDQMLYNLHRDEPAMSAVRERFSGFREYLAAIAAILLGGEPPRGRGRERLAAAIGHSVAYTTWRSLAREQGLCDARAADLMARFIATAAGPSRGPRNPRARRAGTAAVDR
jgi:AcrR family transcriptional regulator